VPVINEQQDHSVNTTQNYTERIYVNLIIQIGEHYSPAFIFDEPNTSWTQNKTSSRRIQEGNMITYVR